MPQLSDSIQTSTLNHLFERGDIWRGKNNLASAQCSVSSGYGVLDACLVQSGWPLGNLIEVALAKNLHAEWQLFLPACLTLAKESTEHCWALLNPPHQPFVQSLLQAGVDLNRLLIVETHTKKDFLASFVELARSPMCKQLFAWQPANLNYTELRKCVLATQEGRGLCTLFRSMNHLQQASPAHLRLSVQPKAEHVAIEIHKQKGVLNSNVMLNSKVPPIIYLPMEWQALPKHADLGVVPEKNRKPKILPFKSSEFA